jgi:hypothetical protein
LVDEWRRSPDEVSIEDLYQAIKERLLVDDNIRCSCNRSKDIAGGMSGAEARDVE